MPPARNVPGLDGPLRSPHVLFGGGSTPPPTFGEETIADQAWTVGTAVSLELPAAMGGKAPVAYSLTPALPAGVGRAARMVTGTPTAVAAEAEYTWLATDAGAVTAELTFDITVAAGLPLAPASLAATADSTSQITLTWGDTVSNGADITSWQWRTLVGGVFSVWADIPGGGDIRTYAITGLAAYTNYTVQIRAVNSVGGGPTSQVTQRTQGEVATVPDDLPSDWPFAVPTLPGELNRMWIDAVPVSGGYIWGVDPRPVTGTAYQVDPQMYDADNQLVGVRIGSSGSNIIFYASGFTHSEWVGARDGGEGEPQLSLFLYVDSADNFFEFRYGSQSGVGGAFLTYNTTSGSALRAELNRILGDAGGTQVILILANST